MSNIKKYAPKVLSAVLSFTIVCSGIGVTAYSAGVKSTGADVETIATTSTSAKALSSADDSKKLSKDETVYVIADANGGAKKIIVSDWIKNTTKQNTINDISNLKGIENLKGDETYQMNDKNMCVWDANGSDIYYQGTGTDELPVDLSVSYKLDGKKISAEELAGKNGKVTIHFDYKNKQTEKVKIDGKEEEIYVPFVMLTGMVLDNDSFRNVKISNGKVINDGDHTYVAGFACPGLQEDLDIDKDTLEIPNSVEITADVENFELATTLTLATNDVFSDADFSKVDDKVSELSKSLDEMTTATDKLIDGSSQLYDGLSTLLDKSDDLITGIETLVEGSKQLKDGASSLDNGASSLNSGASSLDDGAGSLDSGASSLDNGAAQLQAGIATLATGLGTLSSNSASLDSGAKQVFDTLLATADTQIAAAGISADKLTIDNYGKVLDAIVASLDSDKVQQLAYDTAYKTVSETVNSQKDVITDGVTAAVKNQVLEGVLAAVGYSMSAEQYDQAVAAGQIPDEVQLQVSQAVVTQMSSDDIQATIESTTQAKIQSLIDENMQSENVQTQINEAVQKAAAGKKSIEQLKMQLDSYNQFYQGVLTYTAGVDSANSGAGQLLSGVYDLKNGTSTLKNGTSTLKNGTSTLKNGTNTLKNGTSSLVDGTSQLSDGVGALKDGSSALVDGVKQLTDGAMTLNDGLKQFKKDGVEVLVDAVDGDVKGLVNRLKAISKVSSNYKSYSGISDDMNGKVDFIYKTDSIESK